MQKRGDVLDDTGTVDSSVIHSLRQFSYKRQSTNQHGRIIPNLATQQIRMMCDMRFNDLDESVRGNSNEHQSLILPGKDFLTHKSSVMSQHKLVSMRSREFVR